MTRNASEQEQRRCLKVEEWPPADREAWTTAIRSGHILDEAGPASHWSPATIHKNRRGYGRWLTFLREQDAFENRQRPEDRVTRDIVRRYLARLEAQDLASYSIVARIDELRAVITALAPDEDWSWLTDLVTKLRNRAQPRENKRSKIVPSGDLFRRAIEYMDAAEVNGGETLDIRAIRFRDGLMIALLACRPLRLSNLASIQIGRHLVQTGAGWLLTFESHEMKNRRSLEVPFPDELVPHLERYLDHWRAVLLGHGRTDRLWVTRHGNPMTCRAIYDRVTKVTKRAFEMPLNPHLFRDCAATSIAIEDPEHVRISASILGHASLATTEKYYNQARTLEAGRMYQGSMMAMRREMKRLHPEND